MIKNALVLSVLAVLLLAATAEAAAVRIGVTTFSPVSPITTTGTFTGTVIFTGTGTFTISGSCASAGSGTFTATVTPGSVVVVGTGTCAGSGVFTGSGAFSGTLRGTFIVTGTLVFTTPPAPAANSVPETTLAATPISGNAPLTTVFTALCQDPDGLIASCVLSFGDGTTRILSNIQVPQTIQHTYMREGNFLATLAAVDNAGAQDQTPAVATISAAALNRDPQTELFATPIDGRSPFEVTFLAACRDDDGTISSCELEFGDGERAVLQNMESPQTVMHQYVNTEDVKIIRAAILKARDDKGASDQTPDVRLINVLPGFDKRPETFLEASPRRGKTPLEVTFIAMCFDADGEIRDCEINFGDGETEELLNTEKQQEVTHVYTNTRLDEIKFKAELKATDDDGFNDVTPAEVQVIVETDIGRAPNTILSATPLGGPSPLVVTFTARCTDLEKRVTQCRLDFGDGTAQSLPLNEDAHTVKHIYRSGAKQTFVAKLDAMDHEGLIDLSPDTLNIVVNEAASLAQEKTFEFSFDVKNTVESRQLSARKRLSSAFLFGGSELRMRIPKSHVDRVVLEVADTNNLNDLVISMDSDEIYRDEPEKGTYTIPVGEDFEGTLRVRAESPGITRFWESNFYDVRVTVFYRERTEQFSEQSFTVPTLLGLERAELSKPAGVTVTLNEVPVESGEISRNLIQQTNTIRFGAEPDAAVAGKAFLILSYSEQRPAGAVSFLAYPAQLRDP
ncbi:MAG: PKD domain-containing protein [Candidatus Aenigmarchaeota archaeon]|nr:PKD domain-containing protein [Candidatus Aenigmarchaeota archaeon]